MIVIRTAQPGEIADGRHTVNKLDWPLWKQARYASDSCGIVAMPCVDLRVCGSGSGDGRDPSFYDPNSTGPTFDGPPIAREGKGNMKSMALCGARHCMTDALQSALRKQELETMCFDVGPGVRDLASIGMREGPNTKASLFSARVF